MTGHKLAIVHIGWIPTYRLRLDDGTYVFMVFHRVMGVMGFYRDKAERREITDWFNNPLICKAFDWFCNRGNRA